MYMTPTNIPGISLHLTPAMIDKGEAVQPWQLLVDVPLKYDTLPEEVQKTILQALAADGGGEEQDIQQDTICVYVGLPCNLRHGIKEPSELCALVPEYDNMSLTVYAMATPDAEGQERHVSALLDNIGAYFKKDGKGTASADAQAYADHIRRDIRLLMFADNNGVSAKNT